MPEWHDDDRFWAAVAPWIFAQRRWNESPAEVDQLVALAGEKPPASVLDLCCGPGRHSLELSKRGFNVVGVDRTKSYITQATKNAASAGLGAQFICEDMRVFRRAAAFDLALNLFTSFGYFVNPAEDLLVLQNLRYSLKPGGKLVMDLMSKEVLARVFRERDWSEEDGIIMLRENKLSRN